MTNEQKPVGNREAFERYAIARGKAINKPVPLERKPNRLEDNDYANPSIFAAYEGFKDGIDYASGDAPAVDEVEIANVLRAMNLNRSDIAAMHDSDILSGPVGIQRKARNLILKLSQPHPTHLIDADAKAQPVVDEDAAAITLWQHFSPALAGSDWKDEPNKEKYRRAAREILRPYLRPALDIEAVIKQMEAGKSIGTPHGIFNSAVDQCINLLRNAARSGGESKKPEVSEIMERAKDQILYAYDLGFKDAANEKSPGDNKCIMGAVAEFFTPTPQPKGAKE